MPGKATKKSDQHNTTNLRISKEAHCRAKASATLLGEEFYEFVENAIVERINRLKGEGRLAL